MLPSYQLGGTCNVYAETPTAGCSAHFSGTGKGAPKAAAAGAGSTTAPTRKAANKAPAGASGASGGRIPALPGIDQRLAKRAAEAAARATHSRGGGPPADPSQLLNWLLKP